MRSITSNKEAYYGTDRRALDRAKTPIKGIDSWQQNNRHHNLTIPNGFGAKHGGDPISGQVQGLLCWDILGLPVLGQRSSL
jgi:hypothetical protein